MAPRIALMPQDLVLPHDARVLDALAYRSWLHGVPSSRVARRSKELLEVAGLADRAGDKVCDLSAGMVRRLAFVQALAGRPDVLLLDEPTTGLDPEQRAAVRTLIGLEEHRAPITVVSSHLVQDTGLPPDRVLMLDAGNVRFTGSAEEFVRRPDGTTEELEAAFLRRLFEAEA